MTLKLLVLYDNIQLKAWLLNISLKCHIISLEFTAHLYNVLHFSCAWWQSDAPIRFSKWLLAGEIDSDRPHAWWTGSWPGATYFCFFGRRAPPHLFGIFSTAFGGTIYNMFFPCWKNAFMENHRMEPWNAWYRFEQTEHSWTSRAGSDKMQGEPSIAWELYSVQ